MNLTTRTATMELYAIAPTQFAADTTVDVDAMVQNAERLANTGIRRLLLTGSYGEFQSLTDDERLRILEGTLRSGGSQTVMACAASSSTTATIVLAMRMLEAGADLVMVSVPLACELTEGDILRHFERLSRAVGERLVVYNNPVFGVDLTPENLGAIAEMGGYAAIKQGTRDLGNFLRGLETVRAASADVRVLAASDTLAAASLAAGVDGLTSTNCWIFPEVFSAMVVAASVGDLPMLARLGAGLRPYRDLIARFGQPATVKAAMRLRGYVGSAAVRLPYSALDRSAIGQLSEALKACDALLADAGAPSEAIA